MYSKWVRIKCAPIAILQRNMLSYDLGGILKRILLSAGNYNINYKCAQYGEKS